MPICLEILLRRLIGGNKITFCSHCGRYSDFNFSKASPVLSFGRYAVALNHWNNIDSMWPNVEGVVSSFGVPSPFCVD